MSHDNFKSGAAFVVGGSGGIGQIVCERFAAAGSDVALSYNRNSAAARVVIEKICNAGRRAQDYAVDLSNIDRIRQVFEQVERDFGSVHTIVYAAGPKITGVGLRPIAEISPAEWANAVQSEVIGYFNLLHFAIPVLRRSRGSIVALTTAGLRRYPSGDVLSAGPKAAVEMLTRGVAREEGRNGIRANCIGVGWIEAGMGLELLAHDHQAEIAKRFLRATPLRRFGTAGEVGDLAVYLASDAASYVSGNLVCVDGAGHV